MGSLGNQFLTWISWVPTVGGRLSFSVIGETAHPSQCVSLNLSDGNKRQILCHQKRNLNDSILGPLLAKIIFGHDTNFWFLTTASCSDSTESNDSRLTGIIYVFSNANREWRKFEDDGYNALRRDFTYNQHFDDLNTFEFQVSKIQKSARKYSFYSVEFVLERNGIVKLTNPKLNEDLYEVVSLYDVARQSFYYLKDTCHIHQHHHPKTDTLVDLQVADDKGSWRENIARTLYRKILDHKRYKTIESFDSALGLIPYVESFLNVTKSSVIRSKSQRIRLDHTLVEKSIRVKRDKRIHNQSRKAELHDSLRTTLILLFGLFISLFSLSGFIEGSPPRIPEDHIFTLPIYWLFKRPVASTSFVVLVGLALTLLPRTDWLIKTKIFRNLLRWMIPFGKPLAMVISLVLTVIFCAATAQIFISVVFHL